MPGVESSAVRDILKLSQRPEVSLAGGIPAPLSQATTTSVTKTSLSPASSVTVSLTK
jgi:hypothetical protein